jgi:putative acetyltransferase
VVGDSGGSGNTRSGGGNDASSAPVFEIRVDDVTGAEIVELVRLHLEGMHASSPACSVHALGIEALRERNVTVWSAWELTERGTILAGMGALKNIDGVNAELKSMRVADAYLGRGVGRAVLTHIETHAMDQGVSALWLETGSTPEFDAARALYARAGYTECGPFADYVLDPFSVFMTKDL